MNNHSLNIVYNYTRAQAIADGVQVEVTKTAQERQFSARDNPTGRNWGQILAVGLASYSSA